VTISFSRSPLCGISYTWQTRGKMKTRYMKSVMYLA